jgi:hypothetical protein
MPALAWYTVNQAGGPVDSGICTLLQDNSRWLYHTQAPLADEDSRASFLTALGNPSVGGTMLIGMRFAVERAKYHLGPRPRGNALKYFQNGSPGTTSTGGSFTASTARGRQHLAMLRDFTPCLVARDFTPCLIAPLAFLAGAPWAFLAGAPLAFPARVKLSPDSTIGADSCLSCGGAVVGLAKAFSTGLEEAFAAGLRESFSAGLTVGFSVTRWASWPLGLQGSVTRVKLDRGERGVVREGERISRRPGRLRPACIPPGPSLDPISPR